MAEIADMLDIPDIDLDIPDIDLDIPDIKLDFEPLVLIDPSCFTKFTHKKKAQFLIALNLNMGNISQACNKVGISRRSYYDWMEGDDKFSKAVEEVQESLIDFSESKLLMAINNNNIAAIIFHLKTKGKARGYVERQEITGRDGRPIAEPSEKQVRNAAENALKALDARKRIKEK